MTRSLVASHHPASARVMRLLAAAWLLAAVACQGKPVRPPRPAVPVTVAIARRAAVPYTIDANGLVTPIRTSNVTSQVDGLIQHVAFQEGQDVKQGQVLFQIDARPYQAAYAQARAALARDKATEENAKREAERYQSLVKDDYVTKEQADQQRATAAAAQATVSADEATVANAKFNLDNTTIRAPIAGRTGGLLVREGNVVHGSATSPLVVINQVSPILVRFAVPSTQLPLIQRYGANGGLIVTARPGVAPSQSGDSAAGANGGASGAGGGDSQAAATAATPGSDAPRGQSMTFIPGLQGKLTFIDNAVDTTTSTVLLKASFTNESRLLWVGQFVATTLRLFVEQNALVVPSQAVVTGQQGTYVYVVDSANSAQQRKVTVERTAGTIAIIASGINDGERVVTDGQSRLTRGAKVAINTGNDAGAGGGVARRGARGGGAAGGPAGAGATPGGGKRRKPA